MKVLHVHKYFHERDGAGRYMLSLMRALEERGHATAPFAMHDPRNIRSPWEKYFVATLDTTRVGGGIDALRQVGRALWSFDAARKMRAMLAAFHPDVVHAHNLYTHLSPSVLAECRRADVPVVMTVHDYALVSANYALWGEKHPLAAGKNSFLRVARSRFIKGSFGATAALEAITRLQRMFGMVDRNVDRYITLSQFVKDVMVAVGYDEKKIVVVPPGIERRDVSLKRLGNDILFVGRLETYKGVHVLIDAMRSCRAASLRVVGDGPMRTVLEAQARGMKNIRFDGFLAGAALRDAYMSARVLVVPSLWYEPFGLVALEAMSAGVPVIVSDRGGLPEVVDKWRASGADMSASSKFEPSGGLVVPAGDVSALAAAIRRFVDDPVWAEEMGRAAKARAAAFGTPGQHLERIMGIYEACG